VADASVDVALSTMSFHHWHDRAASLREVARVLRPKAASSWLTCFYRSACPGSSITSHQMTQPRCGISSRRLDCTFRSSGGVSLPAARDGWTAGLRVCRKTPSPMNDRRRYHFM